MTALLEAESTRLAEQQRLDQIKTAKERNKWGQFATPPALSLDIAQYVWKKLHRRNTGFRFLDPAVGTGSFFGAFLQAFPKERIEGATGVELDPSFADAAETIWGRQGLQIVHGDFTSQKPDKYNVILTNPPYVRHHHLTAENKRRLGDLALKATGIRLNGLAGLYCYFLLIAHTWLAKDGMAAWLIPSEFMDVNYGEGVKRYLTECVSLLEIHRFCPSDVQFDDALVSSAIVIFENRKPKPDHEVVFSFGGTLSAPEKKSRISLDQLRVARKWTSQPQEIRNGCKSPTATLGDFFTIKRGLATGNNDFFIVPRSKLQDLGIPACCVRPILPSPRFLHQEYIDADADGWPLLERRLALIDCSLSEEEISKRWPCFAEYLEVGRKQEIHRGYLASRRSPWYSQENREAAPIVCTYMGRSLERPFRFILNRSKATAANVYHLLYPRAHVARQLSENIEEVFHALQTIDAEQFFRQGRVYGGGLFKIEPAEMMRLPANQLVKVLGTSLKKQRLFF